MPDIQLLPEIAVYFGCRIDDLFDFSEQAQFDRIENLLQMQETLNEEEFRQAEAFLKRNLAEGHKKVMCCASWPACATTKPMR